MDLDRYKAKIGKIDKEARDKKFRLNKEYALANSHVKIGDIVTDHIGSVCVESIRIFNDRIPSCIYMGTCITKAGKPFKSGEKRSVFQEHMRP